MISSLKKFSIKAYGKGDVQNILEWGKHYYNVFSNNEEMEFKIFFPRFFVTPRSIITKATQSDTFPTEWKLSISPNDEEYITIFEGNAPFCSSENVGKNQNDIVSCNIEEEKMFEVNQNKGTKGKYVKFTMTKNTYNYNNEYQRLITFRGFDIIGTAELMSIPYKCRNHSMLNQILYLLIIIY